MRKFELFTPPSAQARRAAHVLLWTAVALASACHEHQAPVLQLPNLALPGRSTADTIVAKVNGAPIYQSDVERQSHSEGVKPSEALQTLITLEALSQRALARHLGAGKGAEEGWRQILVQAYVERQIEPQLTPQNIPDVVLRQVYDRTKDGYMHSRLVRIAIVDLYAFGGKDPQRREHAALWARELGVDLKRNAGPEDLKALSQQAKWVDRGLKYGVTWQSDKQPYSAAVAQAAMALHDWGETTPVIEDQAGFHLAMYCGERAPHQETFEDAKDELRTAIFEPWRQRRFNEITQQLASEAGVTVMPEVLFRQSIK